MDTPTDVSASYFTKRSADGSADFCYFCDARLIPAKLLLDVKTGCFTVPCSECGGVNVAGKFEKKETLPPSIIKPIVPSSFRDDKEVLSQKSSQKMECVLYRCTHCRPTKTFKLKVMLKKHMLGIHWAMDKTFNVENAEKLCNLCHQTFKTVNELISHISADHKRTRPEGQFKCDLCNYSSNFRRYLDSHALVHILREKPFECPTCKKKFALKSKLAEHVKIHTGETPYWRKPEDKLCNLCGRMFKSEGALNAHIEMLHCGREQRKKFKCDLCDYSSALEHLLNSHKKVHTDRKPVVCEYCGKQFLTEHRCRVIRDTIRYSDVKPQN